MEMTIAEQIQSLGLGKWMPGAQMTTVGRSLIVYLPMEYFDRFAAGCHMQVAANDEMMTVRVIPDDRGSRAHPSKNLRKDAPAMFELSRAHTLIQEFIPVFGRSPCEFAVTPAEIVVRICNCDMIDPVERKRVTTPPRLNHPVNRGGRGRVEPSDNLTRDEQAIKAGGLDLDAANAVAEKLAQDWREGAGAPVAEAWNKTNGVSDVTLLRSAVRTINAAKDARGGSLTLQLSDDGHLIVLLTETTTIR